MEHEPARSRTNILDLATETRFMIYDHVLNFTGSLVVFAQYEFTQNIDEQTMDLLHVSRTIRKEVQEYFYRNQHFQFRSFPAMESFLDKIGPYYTGVIKKVLIGSWLAQRAGFGDRMAPLLKGLRGIEQFAIIAPASGFISKCRYNGPQIGDKTIAVLRASERLAAGKLYYAPLFYVNKFEICFTAEGVQHPPDEDFIPREQRFLGTGEIFIKYNDIVISDHLRYGGDSQKSTAKSKAVLKEEVKAQIQEHISAGTYNAVEIDDESSASELGSVGTGEGEDASNSDYAEGN